MAKHKAGFSMVSHLLEKDKRYLELNPDSKLVLLHLYLSVNNRDGLVKEGIEEIALFTGLKTDEVLKILKTLEQSGRIFHLGLYTVLLNWREWAGGQLHRNSSGLIKMTKGLAAYIEENEALIAPEVLQVYAQLWGAESIADLLSISDRPDTRGRQSTTRRKRPPKNN